MSAASLSTTRTNKSCGWRRWFLSTFWLVSTLGWKEKKRRQFSWLITALHILLFFRDVNKSWSEISSQKHDVKAATLQHGDHWEFQASLPETGRSSIAAQYRRQQGHGMEAKFARCDSHDRFSVEPSPSRDNLQMLSEVLGGFDKHGSPNRDPHRHGRWRSGRRHSTRHFARALATRSVSYLRRLSQRWSRSRHWTDRNRRVHFLALRGNSNEENDDQNEDSDDEPNELESASLSTSEALIRVRELQSYFTKLENVRQEDLISQQWKCFCSSNHAWTINQSSQTSSNHQIIDCHLCLFQHPA